MLAGPAAFAWTTSVPAVGDRDGAIRATDRARAGRSPPRSTIEPAWTSSRSSSGTYPAARRSRSRAARRPPLPLARWRSQGWVQEIGVSDLRLDEQEAGLLLEAVGVELDPTQLSELTERTEGWPSGLYLAALSLQAGGAAVGVRRGLDRQRPVRRPSTSASSSCRGCRRTRRSSSCTHRCWIACVAVCATPCSRRRGLRRCSRGSGARTASSCRSTGRASGIATTTCSASSSATSSSGASRTWRPSSTGARWPGASPTTWRRTAVALRASCGRDEHRRRPGRRPLAPPLYYDGRLETARGVARVVRRRRARGVPRARRLRGLVACADGASRGGRALARPRRRCDLEDPALGRERHDRAVGRHAARAHDAERRRAGARRRRCGAGSAAAGQLLGSYRAPRPRRRARPARRHGSRDGRLLRNRRAGAGDRQRRGGLPGGGTARAPRGQGGSLGRGRATRAGGRSASSTRRASATTRRARSCTSRQHGRAARGEARRMSARRWRVPTACGRCSTTAFRG